MGDNRGYRALSVLALVLGVLGVTLGYAAFSNTLTIQAGATVTPDPSKFNVDFTTTTASINDGTGVISPTLSPNDGSFTATDASIDNTSDPVVTDIHATFTEPGQTATYTFYAKNIGEYIAYLNSVEFDGTKTCLAQTGTTQSLVDAACNGITMTVTVGSDANTTNLTADATGLTGHSLALNATDQVTVVITYASGSAIADGNFDVTFPNVVLTYESAD